MKIKNAQSAVISNHELLLHLRAEEAEYEGTDGTGRGRPKPPGLKNMLQDTLTYLDTNTPHLPELISKHSTRPMTLYKGPHSLYRALASKYRLNQAEYLQMYNLRPRNLVMLDLIIEEAGSRFTEEQQEDILATIARVFDEEESEIPVGIEEIDMPKVPARMKGVTRKKRGVRCR
ncbi:hypothetical protein CC78DRAFT_530971 [Lojkania enalia]|uniref:DNA-directed RNA polymerase III subunit RPC9 n=1 Tax=Lojkania enalia TaxID=147567 RepID=A0A9P4KIN2_9PLEO|nr:hypothetical protein CC78DRAFT_530971 [Didymosphaeria enalia]